MHGSHVRSQCHIPLHLKNIFSDRFMEIPFFLLMFFMEIHRLRVEERLVENNFFNTFSGSRNLAV